MSAPDDYGREAAEVTPPLDALATVTVGGEPITTVPVQADAALRLHLAEDDRDGLDVTDEWPDADEVPEPEFADDLSDPQRTVPVSERSWVTVTVAGDKRVRFTAKAGETLAVHLEQAEGELPEAGAAHVDARGGGNGPETTPQDGDSGGEA